jgi:hypothetical protein
MMVSEEAEVEGEARTVAEEDSYLEVVELTTPTEGATAGEVLLFQELVGLVR